MRLLVQRDAPVRLPARRRARFSELSFYLVGEFELNEFVPNELKPPPPPPMGGPLWVPPPPPPPAPPRLPVVTTSRACAKFMAPHMPLQAESKDDE